MTSRPVSGPPRDYRFPEFRRLPAAGGGRLISCHLPGRPLATATLVATGAGAVGEPDDAAGVALLTARMLAEGTGRRDAYGFAVAAERIGASWRADVSYDAMLVGFDVPAEALPGAVDLLAEAVGEPAFDDQAFARVSAERLDELAMDRSRPGPRAGAAFAEALWEPGSRYATSDGGEPDTVAGITVGGVAGFAAERLRPDRCTLIVTGDLTGIDPQALADRLFAGWTGTGAPGAAGADPARPAGGGRRVVLVDRPGSVQSTLLVGHPGPARACPDYVALTTFAVALGGMFNSRLNLRLREERGFTYGAFAGFELRRDGGVFAARTAVERSVTADALADTIEVLERGQADGLDPAELASAKSYRVGVFPVSFNGPAAVARALAELVVHDLPDGHFDRLRTEVGAVELEAVNAAAAERIRPDQLVSVIVGDADAIEVDPACGPVTRLAD